MVSHSMLIWVVMSHSMLPPTYPSTNHSQISNENMYWHRHWAMHKNIRICIKIDGIIKGETSNILITVCIHPIRHEILISKLLEKAYFTILYKVLWIQKNYIVQSCCSFLSFYHFPAAIHSNYMIYTSWKANLTKPSSHKHRIRQ